MPHGDGRDESSNDDSRYLVGGRYAIGRELARLGPGELYSGVDARRHCEVTIARLDVEYFPDWAGRIALLRHPNIRAPSDVVSTEDDVFVVHDAFRGDTLKGRQQRQRRLPLSEAIDLFDQAAAGLDHAHAAGVVHGHLSPHEVLLPERGAVQLNFDLSWPPAVSSRGGARLEYLAPEGARGEVLDAASDRFSLAAMLYESLVGSRPFQGGTIHRVLAAILEARPAPLREEMDGLPRSVGAVLERALAKERAARFSDAQTMVAAIRSAAR